MITSHFRKRKGSSSTKFRQQVARSKRVRYRKRTTKPRRSRATGKRRYNRRVRRAGGNNHGIYFGGLLAGSDSCRTAGSSIIQRRLIPHTKPYGKTLMVKQFNYTFGNPAGSSEWKEMDTIAVKNDIEQLEAELPFDTSLSADPAKQSIDRQFVLKKSDVMMEFKNATNAQVDVELYMWHPKRDIDHGDANGTPLKAMQRGLQLTGADDTTVARLGGGNIQLQNLYKLPYSAYGNYLKQNYKLVKYAKICLGPYEQQNINLTVIHNKMLTRAYVQNF